MKFTPAHKKYLKLFIAGALIDFAFAPFFIFPVLFISFPIFFQILETAENKKQAFKIGWSFGFGYFVFGLYWIANSLLVDAEKFAWLVPFSVCGIPFLLSIYTGFMALTYHAIAKKLNFTAKIFLLASLWVIFELLRASLFTGFPWNLLGYTGFFSLAFAQVASIGSVYLLSFIIIIIALAPLYYKDKKLIRAAIALVVLCFAFGTYHLNFDTQTSKRSAKVIIFQPNIAQMLKWDALAAKKNFVADVDYVESIKDYKSADIILWPESGVPYYLNSQPWIVDLLQDATPTNGITAAGALRSEGETSADYKVWNTLYTLSNTGIYKYYDKIHLVPFGEFVPFRSFLPIDKITPGELDFSRGTTRPVIKYKNGPSFLPLICYEVIFPEYASSKEKPDLLLNITNDGWFGNSTGPYQHLAMARMRAIEQGVPLIRAANTGVSAIIDQNGRILTSLAYNVRNYIDQPVELASAATVYNKCGDLIILGLILITLTAILIFGRNSQKQA